MKWTPACHISKFWANLHSAKIRIEGMSNEDRVWRKEIDQSFLNVAQWRRDVLQQLLRDARKSETSNEHLRKNK